MLIKPIWLLIIERGVQNAVGNAAYGLYFVAFSITYYLQIILDPGIHTYNQKNLVKDPNLFRVQLANLLPIKLILSLVYGVATWILAIFIGQDNQVVLFWLIFYQISISALLYFRSNISGLQYYNVDSIFSVVDRLIMIIAGCYLLFTVTGKAELSIESFAMTQALATGFTSFLAFGYLKFNKNLPAPLSITNTSKTKLQSLLQLSYPYALLGILMTLYTRIDGVMIERYAENGAEQTGIYAAGFRLLDAAVMLPYLVSQILLPAITDLLHQRKNARQIVYQAFSLLVCCGIWVCLASYNNRFELVNLFNPSVGRYGAEVFGILMFTFIAHTVTYVFGTLLTAAGELKYLNISSAIGLALNILVNLVLIPQYGALGAVAATLCTQSFIALSQLIYAHRKLKISYDLTVFIKLIFLGLITQLLYRYLPMYDLTLPVRIAIITGISIILTVVLQIINIGQIKASFKR